MQLLLLLLEDHMLQFSFLTFGTNIAQEIWVNKSFPPLKFLLGLEEKLELVATKYFQMSSVDIESSNMGCKYSCCRRGFLVKLVIYLSLGHPKIKIANVMKYITLT